MTRSKLCLLLAAIPTACRVSQEPDAAAIRQAIEARNSSAERWYQEGNADSLATIFAQDAWQFPPNMPAVSSRDSIRAFWTAALGWGRWNFDLQTQDLVAGGDIAVERGRFTLTFAPGPQAPMPAIQDRGNYVVLWRREADGQWHAVWDAPVSELPPPGAPR